MRDRLTSRFCLLFLAFAVVMLIFPVMAFGEVVSTDGTTASSTPTIQSDKADYAPGELVTLTGSNWNDGESVNIKVNDTYGASWSRNVDVTANANGQITDSFNLPDWFVSDYDVTATGAQSGTARTTFTDSIPQSVAVSPTSQEVTQGDNPTYTVNVDMAGNSQLCTVTLSAVGLPAGTTASFTNNPRTGGPTDYTSTLTVDTTNTTPAGTHTFRVDATKAAGCNGAIATVSSNQVTLKVNSANQPPTANAGGPYSVAEGGSVQLSGSGTDSDGTIASYAWDLDNNGSFETSGQNPTFSAATIDGPATRTVVLRVTDDKGATASSNGTVSITNVAPNVTSPGAQSASEGTAKSFNLGSFADPGDDDPWTATVDWGDGSSESLGSFASPGSLGSKSHTYADNGNYTVTVTVSEAGSGTPPSGSATFTANVANADPANVALSITDPNNGTACLGGNTVNLGFSFTDAGSADTHKATIAWGDGSTNTVVDPATSPVSGKQHTYSGLGPYTITVTVTDDDGGSGNGTKQLSFHYNVGTTLLSPVNADNSSIFKLGSTIPLKVNITDCNGAGVSGLSPSIKMYLFDSVASPTGETEAVSTQPNDTNGFMRDAGNGQYIYNLASKSLPDSTAKYKAVITDHGYTVTSQNHFSLKAK